MPGWKDICSLDLLFPPAPLLRTESPGDSLSILVTEELNSTWLETHALGCLMHPGLPTGTFSLASHKCQLLLLCPPQPDVPTPQTHTILSPPLCPLNKLFIFYSPPQVLL